MRILGYKPSGIRKALVAVCTVVGVLAVSLPLAGLPAAAAAIVTGIAGVATFATVFLSRANVAAAIDSTDDLVL